jgi:hypothetical protein
MANTAKSNYNLEFITSKDHKKRALAFLISNDKKVNAKKSFNNLSRNTQNWFMTRFEAWRDGKINKNWFHGWDKSQYGGKYTNCFVFESKTTTDRFYGFLHHPKKYDLGYELCILINHTQKREQKTNETYINRVEEIRMVLDVHKSIYAYFKELI